jgi:chromosomal replication initiation ATPase DnaA
MTYYSAAGILERKNTCQLSDKLKIQRAKDIIHTCAIYHDITVKMLCTRTRKRTIIKARKQAIFLILTDIRGVILQDVADLFGQELNYDHSILCHHRKDVYKLLKSKDNNGYLEDINNIKLIL